MTPRQDNFPFSLEGKAVQTRELTSGDLLVEGWAARWDGLDREQENFLRGSFKRSIKSFLNGQAALCFHHDPAKGIGTVLDLEEKDEGLWLKARVDYQPESSPLHYIYRAIRKQSYKGLSVGGFFKRMLTPSGWRITDVDLAEVSVTPVAVHPGTRLAVVATKAMSGAPFASGGDAFDTELDLLRLRLGLVQQRIELERSQIYAARLGL